MRGELDVEFLTGTEIAQSEIDVVVGGMGRRCFEVDPFETSVLNGEVDPFIEEYLRWSIAKD